MQNIEEKLLKSGNYATKQIYSKSFFLKLAHSSRFKMAINIVKYLNPKSVIDYGCGDATFLIMIKNMIGHKCGVEIDTNQLALLKERFKDQNDYRFFHLNEKITDRFNLVTCFEVLEHCTSEQVDLVLDKLKSFCCDNGTVLISVPCEIGLSLIIKQLIRRILSLKKYGHYEYTEWYNTRNFLKMLFANQKTTIERNYYEVIFENNAYLTCGHYGFNWKSLLVQIQKYFRVEKISFTPHKFLPSQVWFQCKIDERRRHLL